MKNSMQSCVLSAKEAEAKVPNADGERSVEFLKRGTLQVKLSAPEAPNVQTPHAQDELYLIVRGTGIFNHAG